MGASESANNRIPPQEKAVSPASTLYVFEPHPICRYSPSLEWHKMYKSDESENWGSFVKHVLGWRSYPVFR